MFEIFKLNKTKAAIEENIALLESKQKAMQEKIKALDDLTATRQNKADCAEIVKFYLCQDSRGMKIRTKLFSLAEECARLAGYKKLYIESFPQFSSAVSMYKKNGFTELSSRLGNSGHTATTIHLIKEI